MMRFGHKKQTLFIFSMFVLPVAAAIVCMLYIPFVMNFLYAFTQWNGIQKQPTFIGLENFREIFTEDRGFSRASIFTVKYGIWYIGLVNVLALLLAVILDLKLKTRNILRAAFFLPYILSLVIVGFIWKFIFLFGFDSLNNMTGWGIFQLSWLGDHKIAFFSVLLVSVWQSIGFYMVIYIAGLQSIPVELLEAATIDGAGALKKFWSVTFPLLMPSITSCVFLSLTSAVKVFDVIVSLTGAGPGRATASVTFDIYTEAFSNNRYGYGTAKSLLLFIVVLVITALQVSYFKSKEVEL